MPLSHLVVVVPGIGGSNLKTASGALAWGHNIGVTATTAFRPDALAIDQEVVPTGLLRFDGVFPWAAVASYGRLTRQIKQRLALTENDVTTTSGPADLQNPSASVVEFAYDFRQGMEASAERLTDTINAMRGNRRVVVVAHSMGGLVARWWWGALGGHQVCDGLITIGTPHRGAPKALDWLLNGVRIGPGPIGTATGAVLSDASELLRGWPAMYELLPRYPVVESGTDLLYPYEVPQAPQWFRDKAERAYSQHLDLERECREAADASPQTEFLAFYSSGHATESRARIVNGQVRVTKEDPPWQPAPGWEGGDGTVPAISATPEDWPATNERSWAPQHHLKLASDSRVVHHLMHFEQAPLGAVRGTGGPTEPWIGLDYDEVIAAEEPGNLVFRLNGVVPSDGITPTATLKLATNRAKNLKVVPRAEGCWQAQLPGLPPGSYEFTVALDHVDTIDRVKTSSVVGVIEP